MRIFLAVSLALLYTVGGHAFVAAVDGSDPIDLGPASSPVWSPDGSQVAFATNRDTNGQGMNEIYVANADGSGLRRLTFDATRTTGAKGSPTWSPDGSTIAYASGSSVWTVPATGGAPQLRLGALGPITALSWSPDGTHMLVTNQPQTFEVAVYDLGTGQLEQAVEGISAVWSPDGDAVAYVDGGGRVAVVSLTGPVVELTDLASAYGPPAWTPDGKQVVFAATTMVTTLPAGRSGFPQRTDLWEAPADGSSPARRLTGPFDPLDVNGPTATWPSVSPDGTHLLYRGSGSVLLANADGTCAAPLLVKNVDEGPAWRPGAAAGSRTTCVDLHVSAEALSGLVGRNRFGPVRFTVENHGDVEAFGVVLHVAPDAHTTVFGCSRFGSGQDCPLPGIPPGGSASLTLNVVGSTPGTHTVLYRVESTPVDITPADSMGSVVTEVSTCNIVGTWGGDVLHGTKRNDRICGLPGADSISGGAGNDYIDAGSGNDTVYGGTGHDTILGRGGRDTIFARDGQRDWIDCGTEYDVAVVDKLDHVSHCERVLRG